MCGNTDGRGTWNTNTAPRYTVALGERGRLVLPPPLLASLDLQPGDRLIVNVLGDRSIQIVSAREQAQRLRGLYSDLAPGRSLAAELIAERREEAKREDAN